MFNCKCGSYKQNNIIGILLTYVYPVVCVEMKLNGNKILKKANCSFSFVGWILYSTHVVKRTT